MVDELRALEHSPSFYNPLSSKKGSKKKKPGKKGSALAGIFGLFFIAIGAIFYGYGNAAPDLIKTNLVEATDIQCANGTIDKEWAFIETLRTGNVPSDTALYLKQSGILIGRLDENNNFTEDEKGTVLKKGDQILSGDALFDAFQTDTELYDAFNNATYSCSAFYYDEAAEMAFSDIGTSRNNITADTNFEELLKKAADGKSNVSIDSATKKTRVITDESGKQTTETYYEQTGDLINSNSTTAEELVDAARVQNPAATETESALNAADVLKVADTASKEQRSSLFFLYFMESIDKMKSGEGDDSNLHDAMNFLTTESTTQVVDVETGSLVNITGTPLDAPSLDAILSGEPVVAEKSKNYSSDRVIQTVANQLNLEVAETKPVNNGMSSSIQSTISSFAKNISGYISRFVTSSAQTVELSVLSPIIPTISSSLIKNSSLSAIYGISGGEMLVEGAVNVGRKLAMQGSGASAGDGAAVLGYHEQVKQIAALNAKVERKNRSPFDITSKNTFLGSIVTKFLPVSTGATSLPSLANKTLALLSPSTHADGESDILTSFGDCATYSTIGAVGSAHCSLIATFDTSTQHDPYNNPEYLAFVEENTYLDYRGNRQVKDGSYLADFIVFNDHRISPFGTIDPGILSAKRQGSGILEFFANISESVSLYDNASDTNKKLASGAAFVNSASNPLWDQYKYAQRYVSINRAVSILRDYSSDSYAYQNLKGCEGDTNPVIAFSERYFKEHPKTNIAYTVEQKTTPKNTAKYPSTTKSLDTSDYHLVIPKVLDQTLAPGVIKFGEYVIKQNNWTLA